MLLGEPGGDAVARVLDRAVLSTVNLAEVLERRSVDIEPQALAAQIEALGVKLVPFSADEAVIAASLRAIRVRGGLSLGDRACLALGKSRGAQVYTADTVWKELPHGVDVVTIR